MKRSAVTAAIVLLVGSGCSTDPGPPEDTMGSSALPASRVEVDTPGLRRLKERSEVEPCPPSDAGTEPASDGLAPVTLPCLGGGRSVHMAGLRGRPMVVNLWASWCTPCRDELPVLQEFHERAGDEVLMLGVDFEDTRPGAALELLRESGVTYPQVADFDKALDRTLGRHPMPTTVLVAPDGEVVATLPVQITSADQLAGYVERSLGVEV
ncbi:MAG: TlpA disulfide reductase family protein [Nocardioidaceae bacterium]